ncbi:Predicted membrane protein [Oligella ureolytica]|uniref:Predicted membrane protein n=1 Tax=Oligella ureolytica TaxID=90244 RepID=A0A378XCF1_9BURK|nr:hypothetical protein [Oligella ureolytica]SUA51307.1 Predicted membrane protein [Oligella ureolytica]
MTIQDFNNQIEEIKRVSEKQKNFLLVTYIVFAVGLFTCGLISIAGLVMVYIKRDDYKNSIYESHVTYLIRTFWIGLLYGFISFILAILGIGVISGILTSIWYVIRVVKGFITFYDDEPIQDPKTWLF